MYYSKSLQDTNTLCPRCGVEMSVGLAIQTDSRLDQNVCIGFGRITIKEPKIIECLKCSKCGHSDDLII